MVNGGGGGGGWEAVVVVGDPVLLDAAVGLRFTLAWTLWFSSSSLELFA